MFSNISHVLFAVAPGSGHDGGDGPPPLIRHGAPTVALHCRLISPLQQPLAPPFLRLQPSPEHAPQLFKQQMPSCDIPPACEQLKPPGSLVANNGRLPSSRCIATPRVPSDAEPTNLAFVACFAFPHLGATPALATVVPGGRVQFHTGKIPSYLLQGIQRHKT